MIIAFDPGFGNSKVAVNGAVAVLQSAVSRPRAIGLAATGMRTASSVLQVELESGVYAAGEGAWQWGAPIGGMDYASLAGEPRLALFYAGLAQLLNPGDYQAELVIGLPVPLLSDQSQAAAIMDQVRAAYKRVHDFLVGKECYSLEVTRLQVLPQPVGAWADWLLDSDLRPRRGAKEWEVGVCDLGMNTLDLYVIQSARVLPRFVGGARVGVRRLLARLNGRHEIEEVDAGLRSGRLKPDRLELEGWLAEVLGELEQVWPDLRRFATVIPAGGGALVLGELLRKALVDRGAAVSWPEDPIAANVRGMWKWGAYTGRR